MRGHALEGGQGEQRLARPRPRARRARAPPALALARPAADDARADRRASCGGPLPSSPRPRAHPRPRGSQNGRLAMLAMLGILGQTCVYGTGPMAHLKDHLAAPFENNIATAWN